MRDNWSELIIGDEISLLNGFPFNSSYFNDEKVGKPLIRIRDLLKSTQVTYFSGKYSDNFLITKGDILVGMDGDFHIVKWKNSPSLLNQRILKIGNKKGSKINIDFLFYYLQPFLLHIHNITAATTVKHLSSYDIINAKEKFPPLPQQRKIAEILSTCDAVIEKTEAAIAKYQAIKQGMMHDLFTRGIDVNTGKLRPSYDEAPHLYKESELGWIPKEWEVKKLEEFGFIYYGKDYKSNPIGDNIPIYGTGGVMGTTSKSLNSGPAVLTGRKGTINRPIYVEGDFWNVDTIFCIKTDNSTNIKWFYYQLVSKDLNKLNEATGVPSINSSALNKLNFMKPELNEQNEITNRLNKIDNKIETEQSALSKYQQLKTGLMQDLLSGKVEVKG